MNHKLTFLLLVILGLSCEKIELRNPSHSLQRDIFIRSNKCGETNVYEHEVISLTFTAPESLLSKDDLKFEIIELVSNNYQRILYKKDHYLYPGLFDGIDHKEFNMPECSGSSCTFELYIFTHSWKGLKNEFKLQIKATDNKSTIFEYYFKPIKNEFTEFARLRNPDIKVIYSNGSAEILVPASDVKTLQESGIKEVELNFQWRKGDKTGYFEKSIVKRLDNISGDLIFSHNIENPTYLGGLLMYKKGHFDYEKKIEIMNDKIPFYECKNK